MAGGKSFGVACAAGVALLAWGASFAWAGGVVGTHRDGRIGKFQPISGRLVPAGASRPTRTAADTDDPRTTVPGGSHGAPGRTPTTARRAGSAARPPGLTLPGDDRRSPTPTTERASVSDVPDTRHEPTVTTAPRAPDTTTSTTVRDGSDDSSSGEPADDNGRSSDD